ncbi:MAG: signal peptide peptidase SppA [Planctomycetota bacterium]
MSKSTVQRLFCGFTAFLLSGCMPMSFLVTPVSGRRALEETELSSDGKLVRDKIALIEITGTIQNAEGFALFRQGENPVSVLLEQLDKAGRDPRVKGVILRINSPGGTVVASELMHQEITHFRKTTGKPVVAMLMDVAASGGYYVACSCDEIIAQPSTVTGSIGVIMLMIDVSGTMNLIGVKSDAITSGAFKDAGSPFRAMKPEERDVFQAIVLGMYDRFVKAVDEGRPKLDEHAVRKLADGRVYLAQQALDVGLIDRIATMREILEALKSRVGIKSARLIAYQRSYDYRPNYYASAPPSPPSADMNLVKVEMSNPFTPSPPRFLYLWTPGGMGGE